MNYAVEIKKARNDINMKQSELAFTAECTQSMVSKIENGLLAPSIDLLIRLADALGMNVSIDLTYKKSDIEDNVTWSDDSVTHDNPV